MALKHEHYWPGTRPDLRLVPKGELEIEDEIAENRSLRDWYASPIYERASDRGFIARLAPLRQRRAVLPVGGGVLRKLRLVRRRRFTCALGEASVALIPLLALALIGWAKSQGWLP